MAVRETCKCGEREEAHLSGICAPDSCLVGSRNSEGMEATKSGLSTSGHTDAGSGYH